MIDKIERIKYLVRYLNNATVAYDKGSPFITDKEWDDYYFELKQLEEETGFILAQSPTQSIHFETVSKLNKVKHNHLMLSLDKTKDLEEVKAFLGHHNYLIMGKMDGLTCSLRYINGELVSAETRGNGEIGEDILHNVKTLYNVPFKINYKEELIIDGEIICTEDDFEEFKYDYKNPRNFAAGSIRLLDANECKNRKLTFVAWEVIKGFNEENSLTERFFKLQDLGFTIVPWSVVPVDQSDVVKLKCETMGFPIDGLVFKFDDIEYGKSLGNTDHHFRNAIAFKFYNEEYETELLDIEWSMGRTGQISPVALFKSINIDGTNISRASLSNLSVMEETLGKHPFIGQIIYVSKRNEIIPKIEKAKDENGLWI